MTLVCLRHHIFFIYSALLERQTVADVDFTNYKIGMCSLFTVHCCNLSFKMLMLPSSTVVNSQTLCLFFINTYYIVIN